MGWGLSAHKVGPSHATIKGVETAALTETLFLYFSLRSGIRFPENATEHKPVWQEWISRNTGEMLPALYVRWGGKNREREGRGVVRVCDGERKLCVMCAHALMESCQNPLCSDTVWWQLPPVRESSRLKFLSVLMATVINPRCLGVEEAHNTCLVKSELKPKSTHSFSLLPGHNVFANWCGQLLMFGTLYLWSNIWPYINVYTT